MSVQEQIKNYIASLPEPNRSEMQTLHRAIVEVMPVLEELLETLSRAKEEK